MRRLSLLFVALGGLLMAQTGPQGRAQLSSTTYAQLGMATNGSIYYCSDCQAVNPCVGGGTGAVASAVNAAWSCAGGVAASVVTQDSSGNLAVTGNVAAGSGGSTAGCVQLGDTGNAHTTGICAPGTAVSLLWTLPAAADAPSQALLANGLGATSWANIPTYLATVNGTPFSNTETAFFSSGALPSGFVATGTSFVARAMCTAATPASSPGVDTVAVHFGPLGTTSDPTVTTVNTPTMNTSVTAGKFSVDVLVNQTASGMTASIILQEAAISATYAWGTINAVYANSSSALSDTLNQVNYLEITGVTGVATTSTMQCLNGYLEALRH